jgi:hypothetical protein
MIASHFYINGDVLFCSSVFIGYGAWCGVLLRACGLALVAKLGF